MRISRNLSNKYWKGLLFTATFCCNAENTFAATSQPTVEIRADRTIIYPQRMELNGEESLLDILGPARRCAVQVLRAGNHESDHTTKINTQEKQAIT